MLKNEKKGDMKVTRTGIGEKEIFAMVTCQTSHFHGVRFMPSFRWLTLDRPISRITIDTDQFIDIIIIFFILLILTFLDVFYALVSYLI